MRSSVLLKTLVSSYSYTFLHQYQYINNLLDAIYVIVRHLVPTSSRYKCLCRRWQNDIIETEAQSRFLIRRSNISYEGIYTLKAPCMRGVLHSLKSCRWLQKSMMKFEIRFHWFRILSYLSKNPNVKLVCSITRDTNSFNFINGVQETTQDMKKVSALIYSHNTWPTMHRRLYIRKYYHGIYNLQSDKRLYVKGLKVH